MAKQKYAGYGATVEMSLDGNDWDLFGFTQTITPPPLIREQVEANNLDEDVANVEPGIQGVSLFNFIQVWDPADPTDEKIDTEFRNASKPYWRITYPTKPNPTTDVFNGWISEVAPEAIEVGTRIGRSVSVVRTTDITRTVTP